MAGLLLGQHSRLRDVGALTLSRHRVGLDAFVLESRVEVCIVQQRISSLLVAHQYRQIANLVRRTQVKAPDGCGHIYVLPERLALAGIIRLIIWHLCEGILVVGVEAAGRRHLFALEKVLYNGVLLDEPVASTALLIIAHG